MSRVMNGLAGSSLRGRYVLAAWLARWSGEERWLRVCFPNRVDAVLDLAVPKYWGALFSPSPENGVQRFFACALRSGDVVYDVGANWGFFTLLSAALVGEAGTVVAFEPGAVSVRQLKEHVTQAGLSTVTLLPCAVTERSGKSVSLVVPRFGRLDTGACLASGPTLDRRQPVTTVCLDDFWRCQGAPRVRLLKIDVEGAEWAVLRGADGLLRAGQCDYVVVETGIYAARYGRHPRQTVSLLQELGYSHLYRFTEAPPYLVALQPGEAETLNDNLAAARQPVPFLPVLASLPPPVVVRRRLRADEPAPVSGPDGKTHVRTGV